VNAGKYLAMDNALTAYNTAKDNAKAAYDLWAPHQEYAIIERTDAAN